MIQKILHFYHKQQFTPTFPGIFINPLYLIRRGLFQSINSNKIYLKGRLLDFGCGRKPYRDIIDVEEYVGLDIETSGHQHTNEQIDVYYDGKTIPFMDGYFDSIISSEVFEHIFNLEDILKELYRVLKPGGYIVVTLPFVWEEHEVPYDYARYTSFGIIHLLKKAGFEIVVVDKTSNYIETIFQMCNSYITYHILPKNKFINLILTPLVISPLTILGIILSKVLPENQSFYNCALITAVKHN